MSPYAFPVTTMNSSTSSPQFHISVTALIISTLSFTRLPEVSEFLFRRWQSCRSIDSALDWVPIVEQKLLPLLEENTHASESESALMDEYIPDLRKATLRCDLFTNRMAEP
jgi:hypothetical protein